MTIFPSRWILSILLFACNCLWAQQPFFREILIDPRQEGFKVTTICQSGQGWVFTGTGNGLLRYDGFRFSAVEFPSDVMKKEVSALFPDGPDGLLIGMEDGSLFNLEGDRVRKLISPAKSPVRGLLRLQDGTLWMATYGEGVFFLKDSRWFRPETGNDLFVYEMILHPSGKIVTATDAGMMVFDPTVKPIRYRQYGVKDGLPENIVKTVSLAQDGLLLLGMEEKGVVLCDISGPGLICSVPFPDWRNGSVNAASRIRSDWWIATSGNGLIRIPQRERVSPFPVQPQGVSAFSNVQVLFADRDHNIWVAADNRLFFSPGPRLMKAPLPDYVVPDSIQAITATSDGTVFFSTETGFFRINTADVGQEQVTRIPLRHAGRELQVVSLYTDSWNQIWLGTFDRGLFQLNPKTGRLQRYPMAQAPGLSDVIAISGRDSVMYLATLGGVVRVDLEFSGNLQGLPVPVFSPVSVDRGGYKGFVYCVLADRSGNVWLGTDGDGLTGFRDGKQIRIQGQKQDEIVYSLTEDAMGNIWYSTQRNGVYRFDGKRILNIGLEQGLTDLSISGIRADSTGKVLVVARTGLFLIDAVSLNVENIGPAYGLTKIDADLNALSVGPGGRIWMAGREGLLVYNPDTADARPRIRIAITRITTYMKTGVEAQDSIFEYNQNNLAFTFNGLWYKDPSSVHYRYRLLGLNESWIPTAERTVNYNNLPPGNYEFQVTAGPGEHFSSGPVATFRFVIRKVFWKESWFILSVTAVLFVVVVVILRDRETRFRKVESLKKEKIEYQFATLKSQVNPHFLFNSFNTLMAIIDEDQGKAIDYVSKLSDYFRNMVRYRERDVIPLAEEIEMLRTYYFLQKERYGEQLRLDISLPEGWMHHFGLPPLTLQLLMENAIKHNEVSRDRPLTVELKQGGPSHLLVVNNLSPKIQPEASTGIGLQNIIQRIRILTGNEIDVKKTESIFEVKLTLMPLET